MTIPTVRAVTKEPVGEGQFTVDPDADGILFGSSRAMEWEKDLVCSRRNRYWTGRRWAIRSEERDGTPPLLARAGPCNDSGTAR